MACRLRAGWEQFHRGSDKAGRIAVMPSKVEFQEIQQTNQEMQFVEGKDRNAMEQVSIRCLWRPSTSCRSSAAVTGSSPRLHSFTN